MSARWDSELEAFPLIDWLIGWLADLVRKAGLSVLSTLL